MNKILVIAPDRQHMVNWIKSTKLPISLFIYVDDFKHIYRMPMKMRYVWIDSPREFTAEKTREAFKARESVELSLDIDDWPVNEFPQHG